MPLADPEVPMEFAIQIRPPTYEGLVAAARWAERRGLAAIAVSDHFLSSRLVEEAHRPAHDTMALLGGLARDTTSIQIVDLVSPVTIRHPAVLAKTAATIQEMSGGRFTLGVGTGWLAEEHTLFGLPFPDTRTRFAMLEEALAYLRAAFAEPPRSFAGTHYRFEAFDMNPRPPLRIVVGGTGRHRTPTLAGGYADEFNVYPAPPDVLAGKIGVARSAAVAAGRDPSALLLSSAGVIVAGASRAEFRVRLAELAKATGSAPDALEASLRDRNAPCGTWAEVGTVLADMERLGVTRFYLQSLGDTGLDRLDADLEQLQR